MSFFLHYLPLGSALVLITVGTLIGFRNRDPKRWFLNMFGGAVFLLGVTINGLVVIATDVPIDSWSTGDWIVGVAIAMSLLLVAFLFGRAYEMRRHQEPGADEAQRVGTGFSPR
jgi:hypothetical protein